MKNLKIYPRMLKDESPKFTRATDAVYAGLSDPENISRKEIINLTLILLFSHGFLIPGKVLQFAKLVEQDNKEADSEGD